MTLLACGACGGDLAAAVPFGVAAELTHSATLLHDDVLDGGEVRRGQPASRVIWGNNVSVLAGDWLLTRALEIVAGHRARADALPPLLATMRRLVEGEVKQLSLRGRFHATEGDYFEVIRGKTASLFGWAAAAGAWAAGVRGEVPDALAAFGEGVGTAFQLVDDALDYAADPELLGKRLGTDLVEGKATLPLIRALRHDARLPARLQALVDGRETAESVAPEVLAAVRRTDGVEAARALAREHTARAMAALERVPDGVHRRAMARRPGASPSGRSEPDCRAPNRARRRSSRSTCRGRAARDYPAFRPASTFSSVKGTERKRTPVASKSALAIAEGTTAAVGSPAPQGFSVGRSMRSIAIDGTS